MLIIINHIGGQEVVKVYVNTRRLAGTQVQCGLSCMEELTLQVLQPNGTFKTVPFS